MTHIHSAAAVAHQANLIESFCVLKTCSLEFVEFFPFVGNDATATKTSYWNNHFITSSIRLLLLSASTTTELVLWFLAPWIVDQKAAIKA